MNMQDLTSAEIALIEKSRAEDKSRADARIFQQKSITVANQFLQWSLESGYGLTFSTFVNQFDYQDPDGNRMYRAVERILSSALPD